MGLRKMKRRPYIDPMQVALNVLISLVPVALICALVYIRDRSQPEKPQHLLLTFALGMLFGVPAHFLELRIDMLGYQDSLDVAAYTAYIFLGVAFVQELCKYLPVVLVPFQKAYFDEPLDGIVYCVYAAMGFALMQGILRAPYLEWEGALTRAALTIPAHGAFAMLSGYFLGRARLRPGAGVRASYIFSGLFWAIVAHGLYAWTIMNPFAEWVTLLGAAVLLVAWFVGMRLTAKHAAGPEPTPLADANR